MADGKKNEGGKMRPVLFLIVLLLLFGGCTTKYTHPTKGAQELEQDIKECASMARGALIAKGAPDTC